MCVRKYLSAFGAILALIAGPPGALAVIDLNATATMKNSATVTYAKETLAGDPIEQAGMLYYTASGDSGLTPRVCSSWPSGRTG